MKDSVKESLKQVGKMAANSALNALANKPVTKKQMKDTAKKETAEAAVKAAKKEKMKAIGQTALAVAGKVLPEVAGAIPVVGPIAKLVLSTLNDDEWFSEYTSAGATFNELLADYKLSADKKVRYLTPSIGIIQTTVLKDSQNPVTSFQSQYLPVILAHVRKKTDNVLVASESEYWTAFRVGSELYAIYYTLKKYLDLVDDLPTNIANLPALITPIKPENYSVVKGIIDTLANYLDITIKLPYAWTEYLRWRFGTLFLSDNTGKPGLIAYDYAFLTSTGLTVFAANCTPSNLSAQIDSLKTVLASTSRAVADIRLAYEAASIRFTVEKRHYDEKEFCLRCNLQSENGKGLSTITSDILGTLIYLDSRLNQTAAIQAVTLSNDSADNWAPFHIYQKVIAWFVPEAYKFPFYSSGDSAWFTETINPGWYTTVIDYDVCGQTAKIETTAAQSGYTAVTTVEQGFAVALTQTAATKGAAAIAAYKAFMAAMGVNALQIHNQEYQTVIGTSSAGNDRVVFRQKVLSYDAAIITPTQISAIHRVALRNLFRGNYVNKIPSANKPEVVEAIKDNLELSADLIADALPNK